MASNFTEIVLPYGFPFEKGLCRVHCRPYCGPMWAAHKVYTVGTRAEKGYNGLAIPWKRVVLLLWSRPQSTKWVKFG